MVGSIDNFFPALEIGTSFHNIFDILRSRTQRVQPHNRNLGRSSFSLFFDHCLYSWRISDKVIKLYDHLLDFHYKPVLIEGDFIS